VTEKKSNKAARLRALQERFSSELPSRLDAIQQEEESLRNNTSNRDTFLRLVHSLAGSSGTFGYLKLGARAHELEQVIQQIGEAPADTEILMTVTQLLADLKLLMEAGPERISPVGEPVITVEKNQEDQLSLIYMLEDDVSLAAETALQLEVFGYRVKVFHSVSGLRLGVAKKVPDVILADIHLPEGDDAGPKIAMELRESLAKNVPVIFISGHDSWYDRLNAVRAGGQFYLSKPVNFSKLLDGLDAVIGNSQQESPFRVLIVDDSKLLAEHYATVLQEVDVQTEVINAPDRILDVLSGFHPDLILMDIYMPGCSGMEAAQVIRQHTSYSNVPIVYLSTEQVRDQQLVALDMGGDDFLQKPISDQHLIASVQIRARRFRELTALMNKDGLTGLLNHITMKLTLEREVAQARRRSSSLSFVMLDIDHFKSVNDSYGHPAGDRVIKSLARLLSQRIRQGDIAARYGGEEFAIILPDTSGQAARFLIDELREQFSQIVFTHKSGEFGVSFSAGIATCPPNQDMDKLIAAADAALYQAKQDGRNQVKLDASSDVAVVTAT